jgi:hypothetical protein
MPDSDHRPKVTIEDLLRLKRTERPPAEFWAGFERELRQKQLAALVEQRSWWRDFPQLFSRRAYLPVGATAVIALTLVSVRFYAPTPVAQIEGPASSIAVTVPAPVVGTKIAEPAPIFVGAPDNSIPVDDRTPVAAAMPLSEQMPEQAVDLVPWGAPRSVETPSAKTIAANIAHLEQTEPELATYALIGHMPVSTQHMQETGAPVVELASVSAVASKRSRLLAHFDDRHFTPDPQAPEIVRERLTRRMADTDYGDRFSRIGVKGDQVSLKF